MRPCSPRRSRSTGAGLTLGAVLAAAALAGCAEGPKAEVAQRAQTALVGLPKGQLLSCAGVPDRQMVADGVEYYSYSQVSITSVLIPESSVCEATVLLRNDRVERIIYSARSYLPDCTRIVQTCMGPQP